MKKILILPIFFCFYSCGQINNKKQNEHKTIEQKQVVKKQSADIEEFEYLNIEELNIKISSKSGKLSPKDIMKTFHPQEIESGEGGERITISEKTINNGNIEVQLIHDNLLDDSVRGEKYIMELKKQDDNWIVVSLKKNWKCWRGDINWGIQKCA